MKYVVNIERPKNLTTYQLRPFVASQAGSRIIELPLGGAYLDNTSCVVRRDWFSSIISETESEMDLTTFWMLAEPDDVGGLGGLSTLKDVLRARRWTRQMDTGKAIPPN